VDFISKYKERLLNNYSEILIILFDVLFHKKRLRREIEKKKINIITPLT
jgi:hypothetical protein